MSDFYEHKLDPVGVRPEWLADTDRCDIHQKSGWCAIEDGDMMPAKRWCWHEDISAIRIPADHWAVPALKQGFTPWPGGDKAPADWDGGEVLTLDGLFKPSYPLLRWSHNDCIPVSAHKDIIGYRKAPERKPSEGVTPELAEALRAGGRVIDYAASILWNGRPQAIAERPAEVDADLRTFRAILAEYEAATKPPVDHVRNAVDEALKEWLQTERVEPDFMELCAKRGLTITKADAA